MWASALDPLIRSFDEMMVLNSDRFLAEERHHSQYKLDSTLTLKDLRKEDFGTYRCASRTSSNAK